MKISRLDSPRRRRSPLSTLPILIVVILLALLIFAWMRGGAQPQHHVEIEIPANQLGH